ncbi:MAG: hypothetical protein ACKVY0_04655 [Prosthecobacter sp.]|uniref:hypothetical protein n=1 Tax=Prosthecobacter sp. TaxID=1965333 RepID=UPI0039026358
MPSQSSVLMMSRPLCRFMAAGFFILALLTCQAPAQVVLKAQPVEEEKPQVVKPAEPVKQDLNASWQTQREARALTLSVPAPRGQIVDRHGVPFAQNRAANYLALVMPYMDGARGIQSSIPLSPFPCLSGLGDQKLLPAPHPGPRDSGALRLSNLCGESQCFKTHPHVMDSLHSGTDDQTSPARSSVITPVAPSPASASGVTPNTRVAAAHQSRFTAAMKGHPSWPLPHIPPFTGE